MVWIRLGLPASFDGLKKGWRKKDAKLEADGKEMQEKLEADKKEMK